MAEQATHQDPQSSSKPGGHSENPAEDSSDASSGYSSFEEDADEPILAGVPLPRATVSKAPEFVYESGGVVVYDSNARMIRYPSHQSSISRNGKEVPPDSVGPGAYPLTPRFHTAFLEEENEHPVQAHEKQRIGAISSCKDYAANATIFVPQFADGVEFFSRFESGNLRRAVRVSRAEYELFLAEDFNTAGHLHWFYFKTVSNLPAGTTIRFRILNMAKPRSLYLIGLKPFVFSARRYLSTHCEWDNSCANVKYKCRPTTEKTEPAPRLGTFRPTDPPPESLYTLEWDYTYDSPGDEVYFAQSRPYAYTDLLQDLESAKERHREILRVSTLCRTESGNPCPVLTITRDVESYLPFSHERALYDKSVASRKLAWTRADRLRSRLEKQRPKLRKERRKCNTRDDVTGPDLGEDAGEVVDTGESKAEGSRSSASTLECTACQGSTICVDAMLRHQDHHSQKKSVVFTGRVHPGEVPSSWVLRGIINFLLSDSPEAELLRSQYVFRIVPMLNPDGVIYGNYRCSVLGFDLNRKWLSPSRHLQPTIFYTKQMIRFLSEEREVALFCDFHAHSTQKNVFMYGCAFPPGELDHIRRNAEIRVVPLLMSQQNRDFSYRSSRFRLERGKESTARVVVFKEFGVATSYTCESSFFWYPAVSRRCFSSTTKEQRQFQPSDYARIGESVCRVAMNYMPLRDCRMRLQAVVHRIATLLYERYLRVVAFQQAKPVPAQPDAETTENSLLPKPPSEEELKVPVQTVSEPNPQAAPLSEDMLPSADLDAIAKDLVEEEQPVSAEVATVPDSDDDSGTEPEEEIRSRLMELQIRQEEHAQDNEKSKEKEAAAPERRSKPRRRRKRHVEKPELLPKICPPPPRQVQKLAPPAKPRPAKRLHPITRRDPAKQCNGENMRFVQQKEEDGGRFPLVIQHIAARNQGAGVVGEEEKADMSYGYCCAGRNWRGGNFCRAVSGTNRSFDVSLGLQGSRIVSVMTKNRAANYSISTLQLRQTETESGGEESASTPDGRDPLAQLLAQEQFSSLAGDGLRALSKDSLALERSPAGFRSKQELGRRSSQQSRVYQTQNARETEVLNGPAEEYASLERMREFRRPRKLQIKSRRHYVKKAHDLSGDDMFSLEGRSQRVQF